MRDVSEEEKITAQSMFGQLVTSMVSRIVEENERVRQIEQSIQEVRSPLSRPSEGGNADDDRLEEIKVFEGELSELLDECVPGCGVELEINTPEVNEFFRLVTRIVVNDGLRTYLESKGHGVQRAMLFVLFRAYARLLQREAAKAAVREGAKNLIFAIEEPELFLHPQLQRSMFGILETIADHDQVLMCSHSTFFVKMDRYASICIVDKPTIEAGSSVKQCCTEIFAEEEKKKRFRMLTEFDPERNELFFTRRVVLVEGDTEKVALPLIARRMGMFRHEVTIIEVGGKGNLELFMRVLNAFTIPYLVVYDVDPIPEDMLPTDPKYGTAKRLFEMNNTIACVAADGRGRVLPVDPEFERVAGISNAQKEKLGGPLAASEHVSEADIASVPERLREIVETVYGDSVW